VFYNSVNILTQSLNNSINRADNQSSVRLANNNNSALCGYCLPTTTAINSSQEVPALIQQHFDDSTELLKHRSLITHFNNYNIIEISTSATRNTNKEEKMVSSTQKIPFYLSLSLSPFFFLYYVYFQIILLFSNNFIHCVR
jgi:hypothetical protein